jgi:negative regulator of flagellin synthesis FlgM
MTERINGQGFRPADTAGTRRSEGTKPAAAESPSRSQPGATASSSSDTVSITDSALLLGKLEEVVQSTPVTDSARVAAIKNALASGSYEVDDRQVADKLLRFERDLLG